MALKKSTQNYEVLIRFNTDSKIGAQIQKITTVTDGGEVLSAKLEQVEALSLMDLQTIVASWTDEDWFVPEATEEV